ncbi:MAG: helix-turn-helix domain-containing protein [Actinomycetia bacterium]|nr:helix-turn-helix domain-containing protein [Actinomycetes bacterium]
MTDWVTTTEAAALLGVNPSRVRQLLLAGRIVGARKAAGTWLIPTPIQVRPSPVFARVPRHADDGSAHH